MRSSFLGTCFSFVLVLVFTVCMTFTSVRTYVLYGNYTGLTDHFNTVGVIFLIFWIVVVALALRLLHPLLRLSPANFALVYAALMVAVVLPSMGFGGYFIPLHCRRLLLRHPRKQLVRPALAAHPPLGRPPRSRSDPPAF